MPFSSHPLDPAVSDSVYHELDDVLDACAVLANRKQTRAEFYEQLTRHVTTALSATGACALLPERASRWTAVAATGVLAGSRGSTLRGRIESYAGESVDGKLVVHDDDAGDHVMAVAITPHHWLDDSWLADSPDAASKWALLAVVMPADMPPSTYHAAGEFLTAVAGVAAEFHARTRLADAASERRELHSLAELAHLAGRSLKLDDVAAVVANEGRRLLSCDRLSVLVPRGGTARLLATSGLEQFDRKSRAVRDLQSLASRALRWKSAVYYGDTRDDVPPEFSGELTTYTDAHEVRGLTAVPIASGEEQDEPLALLLAEQFTADEQPIAPHRVQELATTVAPALHAATTIEKIPLAGVLGKLSVVRRPSAIGKLLLVGALIATIAAALMFIERPFRVRATGELVPTDRNQVFAPHDGIVDRIDVAHGSSVETGDVLLVLRDPKLDAEQAELAGQRATLTSQLESVRATRLSLETDQTNPVELYRLSAEEETIEQKLASLAERQRLLDGEIDGLTIRSPRAGRVLTWQVDDLLEGRPVERGQVLLQVADTTAGWEIHLDVPDRKFGYVQRAIDDQQLNVEYTLAADEQELRSAQLISIADRAQETTDAMGNTTTTIELVTIPDDDSPHDELQTAALRPGSQVRGRLDCGDRSLGYILFHGLTRIIVEWWEL